MNKFFIKIIFPIIVIAILCSIPFIFKKINFQKNRGEEIQSTYNTLISINDEQQNIALIQKDIKPAIDKIIREETRDKDLEFYIKPRHDITLYYLNDFKSGNENIIEQILSKIDKEKIVLDDLELSTNLEFFGNINECVILIKNPEKLVKLHNDIGQFIQDANKSNFYDQQKSEAYSYIPHITLGRLPKTQSFAGSIQEQENLVKKIKARIENEVFPFVKKLITKDNKLSATKITFYKIPKPAYTLELANKK